jgi:hypothetical protein
MGNYADPDATRPITIGPCRCPGTPHATDTADIRVHLGYGEISKFRQAARLGGIEQGKLMLILLGVTRWNLVLPNGSARPVDAVQVSRLDEAIVDVLCSDEHLGASFGEETLPNGSGDPSPDGSPASDIPTLTTPEPLSSTST